MDLNIDQLDYEERRKINALLRERNDTDKDKGVEYIFKQPNDKEDFLLGKKFDLNKMPKDDRALMGESEAEFQERMEKRKLMQKMREDPMAIIQLNEQQAHKVALEKKLVHQKYMKKQQAKFERRASPDSTDSDSDSSDCMDKLRSLLEQHIDEDDEDIPALRLGRVAPQKDKKPPGDRKKERKIEKKRERSRSRSKNRSNRRRSNSRDDGRRRRRSKSIEKRREGREGRADRYREDNRSGRMSREEIERRLQEMKDNARDLQTAVGKLEDRYAREDSEEERVIEKQRKTGRCEEYMMKEMMKMNKEDMSLESRIRDRRIHNHISRNNKRK